MLSVNAISKSFGGQTLFENVSLQINRDDRVALVGANGAGKSTLFSIILGETEPDKGTISREKGASIGYLPQETAPVGDETVLDLAVGVTDELINLRKIISSAESSGDIDSDFYHDAVAEYSTLGGYSFEPKAKRILHGLAFRESDFGKPVRELSGGWVMRAHLARLLVMEPELLMLDEPTNHLDLETLGWFQNYLSGYSGGLLMISHDREFLNSLVTEVIEIRNKSLHTYRGNYNDFLEQRAARRAQHLAAYDNQQREIKALQNFADRFRAKASKASQAQSKLKQIERMEKIDAPEDDEKVVAIRFPQPPRGGLKAVSLENIYFSYGAAKVYEKQNFEAERGQRIVLVGPNGAGKSTLLKLLAGVLEPQQGIRKLGHNTTVGYFAQNRMDNLKSGQTVLENVLDRQNPVPEQMARTVLGSFLFSGDTVFKNVDVLSGGEKSRLGLVKILLDPPNLLLMDEPTTHLDMASIEALINAIKQYEGTLIFISHDVYFIRQVATHVLHISAGSLTLYAGGYDYYLEKSGATSERSALIAGEKLSDKRAGNLDKNGNAEKNSNTNTRKSKEQKRLEAQERQERSSKRKFLENSLNEIELQISSLEMRQNEITLQLQSPGSDDVISLNRELVEISSKLKKLTSEWESLAESLQALFPTTTQ